MNNNLKQYLESEFNIGNKLLELSQEIEEELKSSYSSIDSVSELHQARVLKAFQDCNISDVHFNWNTGYGYDDLGRDAVEKVFARVFSGEKALVRPNIVNGTHAIALALLGLLKNGDKVIYCTGTPYDTLLSVIGYEDSEKANKNNSGTLKDLGVLYEAIPLNEDGSIDLDKLRDSLDDSVKMVAIQRSKGYSFRKSISSKEINLVSNVVKEFNPNIIIMVDNCYCEFVEEVEPLSVGADIICGSLIKNPGGGLALSGGYLCGKSDLIEATSYRLTSPGIGGECGLTFGQNRSVLQGLFQSPRVTAGALKGAIFCGELFKKLGFNIYPETDENRIDIIQAVELKSPEAVSAFCEGIQSASPIDSNVKPVPSPMPGYSDEIIMAAGTFVQGSSIELSADGPLREPYAVYFQGGLTYEHSKIGSLKAAQELINRGFANYGE